ncbi:unnamed protein product [Miscanthus lutarioriparius]|uniref:Uncharacterized protein n=1 Tax=Miscanthus lutarioriparius TaxID=422564 RepID=A0A811RHD7_9POAL|nr:unnamed protein product [Miscanthus lutarioriparius]
MPGRTERPVAGRCGASTTRDASTKKGAPPAGRSGLFGEAGGDGDLADGRQAKARAAPTRRPRASSAPPRPVPRRRRLQQPWPAPTPGPFHIEVPHARIRPSGSGRNNNRSRHLGWRGEGVERGGKDEDGSLFEPLPLAAAATDEEAWCHGGDGG